MYIVESVNGFFSNGGASARRAAAEKLNFNPQRCRACMTRWVSYLTALEYIVSKWDDIRTLVAAELDSKSISDSRAFKRCLEIFFDKDTSKGSRRSPTSSCQHLGG